MEIRLLGAGELAVLGNVADGLFDNEVDPKFGAEFLNDPRHYLCVALDDGRVVGFGSAVRYIHPDKPPQLWINEVGVADSHQKRGIGKAIVWRLVGLAGELGCSEAWVLTEESNEAARALYRSAGGVETEGVIMTTFRTDV